MIGSRIRAYRKSRGMTQAQLAKRIRIVTGPMNAIENGNHIPTGRTLVALATVLGASIDDLCGLRAPPPRRPPDEELLAIIEQARASCAALALALKRLDAKIKKGV